MIEIATKNIASFNINDIQKEYPSISTSDFEKLISLVPLEVEEAEKENYLLMICGWFYEGIAIPLIKKYVKIFVKTLAKKYNIIAFVPFSEFKSIIDNKIMRK